MSEKEKIPLSKQMRLATREVHAISDAMVNAKLAFAMSDNSVWAEGLLVFYEIFRYLEEAMVRLKGTPVGEFKFEELMRTEAFQKDLEFYLGVNWAKNYTPRESVVKYLIHLQTIEKETPILLMAYIYHLYMGLLSGGQILVKKRELGSKLNPFQKKSEKSADGNSVTNFGDHSISSLKKRIVDTTNSIALDLDEETKEKLLEESKMVFVLNNSMIRTIQGTSFVFLKKVLAILFFIFLIIALYRWLF
ncbi:heme oxygenase 1-like [Macrosteles quadrilineatus]|uniref:heme oxygenase 1-like n=1 Tax=Macrosteles quadrilineatus TaxID=74068 RepID=UPI0023E305B3|nr:heme oxygenase 1-like [Macrosteles quadrilineatus]